MKQCTVYHRVHTNQGEEMQIIIVYAILLYTLHLCIMYEYTLIKFILKLHSDSIWLITCKTLNIANDSNSMVKNYTLNMDKFYMKIILLRFNSQ